MSANPILFTHFERALRADEGTQHEERKKGEVTFKVVRLEEFPEGDIMTLTGGELWSPSGSGCRVLVPSDCPNIIPNHLKKRLLDPDDKAYIDLCFDLESATFQFIEYEPRNLFPSFLGC